MMMLSWLLVAFLFEPQASAQVQPAPAPPTTGTGNPVLEVGTARHEVWSDADEGLGPWRVLQGSLSWQPPLRVRPRFEFERQSRPAGTHIRGTAGTYVDWTPDLYSYQALTIAPATSEETRFYPSRRGDIRLFWKVPRHRRVVLALGYTALTFGAPQRTDIVNVGTVVYGARMIAQVTGYLNRNDPGDLISAAGNVSVQVGQEGGGWYGASVGGGRELYRLGTLATPATADFTTVTIGGFARRWFTRTGGFHASAEYQIVKGSYSRLAVTANLFVGF
jgi:YaiO family outer membrane protein